MKAAFKGGFQVFGGLSGVRSVELFRLADPA